MRGLLSSVVFGLVACYGVSSDPSADHWSSLSDAVAPRDLASVEAATHDLLFPPTTGWVEQPLPLVVASQALTIHAIAGSGPNEIYAAGNAGLVLRKSPASAPWTQLTKVTDDDLFGLAVLAPGKLFAVGGTNGLTPLPTLIATSDAGATWRGPVQPGPGLRILSAIVADGHIAWITNASSKQPILHLDTTNVDPSAWDIGFAAPGGTWNAVWVDANHRAYAGGIRDGSPHLIIKFDPIKNMWLDDQTDGAGNPLVLAGLRVNGLHGSGTTAFAVGEMGIVLTSTGDDRWRPTATSPTTVDLFAVWVTATSLMVAGKGGQIWSSTDRGATWTQEPCSSCAGVQLRALWSSSVPGDVYAAGLGANGAGHIFHREP